MADNETAEVVDNGEAGLSDNEIIARRSADIHTETAKDHEHVKVFVLGGGIAKPTKDGYDHEPNKAATRQYAISQGMRPNGETRLVSVKQHPDGVSWVVTYAQPVAVDDATLEVASGPDIVTDQHAAARVEDAKPTDGDEPTA